MNFQFSGFKTPCSLYIHTHLPILGVGKRFEQWLKLTIANIVTELSANNTICWFTKEITVKMKTNTFSIATFVARLSKSWKIWKITGKSWESHEIEFTEIFKIFLFGHFRLSHAPSRCIPKQLNGFLVECVTY